MASAEREPITRGFGGRAPSGVQGQSRVPGQGGQGAKPSPEAESFLGIGHPKEGANWWFDRHECHLESFLAWYTTEDRFVIGVDVAKSGGRRSLKALEFEKWGARA